MVPHPPIIMKEIGKGEENKIRDTVKAYEKAADMVVECRPDTIIISSPHSIMYSDYFHISPGNGAVGDMGRFGAPEVRFEVEYDREFTERISRNAMKSDFPAGVLGERNAELDHGIMVPLYFINKVYSSYKLVRVGLSGLSFAEHYRFGQLIERTLKELGRRAFFVGSGDLSHKLLESGPYGYVKEGPEYDDRIMEIMGKGSFDELFDFEDDFCDKAAECGHRSFCIMAGTLDGKDVYIDKLSYEGTFGVGYGICTYRVKESGDKINSERKFLEIWETKKMEELRARRETEDPYVRLARKSIEAYLKEGKRLKLYDGLPEEIINGKAGVFVSIHKEGKLRGCIGTISPVYDCIGTEIIENAISASTKDPRFNPVKSSELDMLEINVDVLSEAEAVKSKKQLDVKKYGVIVTKGLHRGLLLPDLEGVDTVDEQIEIALKKAGLSEREQDYSLMRFEVVRHR